MAIGGARWANLIRVGVRVGVRARVRGGLRVWVSG